MNMNAVHEETYKGYKIKILPDEDMSSPREFESNMGTMVCFHNRHNLGDKTDHRCDQFSSWEDLENHLREAHGACIVLPLYLYDHSGLRMKVGSFNGLLPQGHAEFDSGQVGFIYADRAAILENYGAKKFTLALMKKARKLLEAEVKVYDQFLSGDVYGYVVSKPDKCDSCGHEDDEEVESCWGYYGMDEVLAEAKAVVDRRTAKPDKKGGKK